MKIVGVTGTLASGKTAFCGYFKRHGAYLLDADAIVHSLLKRNKKILRLIRRTFGTAVFKGTGDLDRARLAEKAFSSRRSTNRLNNIVHPHAIRAIKRRISQIRKKDADALIFIDAPLLIEAGLAEYVDYLIVITAKRAVRLKRAVRGSRISAEEAARRMSLQMAETEKAAVADFTIDNNGSKSQLKRRAEDLWRVLKED